MSVPFGAELSSIQLWLMVKLPNLTLIQSPEEAALDLIVESEIVSWAFVLYLPTSPPCSAVFH